MEDIVRGSSFSRTVANAVKKGAYYTDLGMCQRIGKLLKFPEEGETTVLEPSVGNAAAVRAVLEQKQGECLTPLFAVELDGEAAQEAGKTLAEGDVLLSADFIRGVTITPGVFGYCFANPPYGEDEFLKRRYEQIFLEKIYTYLKKEGICTLVVPYYIFSRDEAFVASLQGRFELLAIYRFDDGVYEQFQQVCAVLRRRQKISYAFGKKAFIEFTEGLPKPEELPCLPENPAEEQRVAVPEAHRKDIKCFATQVFDSQSAVKMVRGGTLDRVAGGHVFAPQYTANELTRPPVPPKKDILYLCAIAGAGQGFCGSEEDGDLHLQRGVVKTVTDSEVRGEGERAVMVEKTRAAISMTVIEPDGRITHLA